MMFPLYFMILFFVYSDGSFGTQSFVNNDYVEKGLCETYIPDTIEFMKQYNPGIVKIHGFCIHQEWPFQPDAQPKGSI